MLALARRAASSRSYSGPLAVLLAVILAAWALCAWAELSGHAARLHHHALYENPRALWLSALLLLAAWQAMTAAMMLPSSFGFIRMYAFAARSAPEFPAALALFVLAYFTVWTIFALAAFAGDMCLHALVEQVPWLGAHAQLIPAGTIGLAALYQLTPLKDACLRACRHQASTSPAITGEAHGTVCVWDSATRCSASVAAGPSCS